MFSSDGLVVLTFDGFGLFLTFLTGCCSSNLSKGPAPRSLPTVVASSLKTIGVLDSVLSGSTLLKLKLNSTPVE